jgi:hypothetical protein
MRVVRGLWGGEVGLCKGKYVLSAARKMGLCDSHSYHALFSTATRAIAVSRTEVGREVFVRMAPRKEFLGEVFVS